MTIPTTMTIGARVESFTMSETLTGFIVSGRPDRRYRLSASVDLVPGEKAAPGAWPETKSIGGRHISFRVDELGGGSGGTEYELTAWEPYSEGYLRYRQRDQTELGGPNFTLAWKLIEGTNLP